MFIGLFALFLMQLSSTSFGHFPAELFDVLFLIHRSSQCILETSYLSLILLQFFLIVSGLSFHFHYGVFDKKKSLILLQQNLCLFCNRSHLRNTFREGNGTLLQYSCLENSMDGGTQQAAVHGVARSRTRQSNFPVTFHFHALEKEMATHSNVLAWRIPGTGEPGGLPSMVSHRVGHD